VYKRTKQDEINEDAAVLIISVVVAIVLLALIVTGGWYTVLGLLLAVPAVWWLVAKVRKWLRWVFK